MLITEECQKQLREGVRPGRLHGDREFYACLDLCRQIRKTSLTKETEGKGTEEDVPRSP